MFSNKNVHCRTQKHPKIVTRNADDSSNGFLVPIYNIHDGFLSPGAEPKRVYLTVCAVGTIKGPHLHIKRRGLFPCIQGNIRIIVRIDTAYEEYFSGEDYDFSTIEVPPGMPAALQNISNKPAHILNMPSPAWHSDNQDEHPVEYDPAVFVWPRK